MNAADLQPGMTVILDDRPLTLTAVDPLAAAPYSDATYVTTECGSRFSLRGDVELADREEIAS